MKKDKSPKKRASQKEGRAFIFGKNFYVMLILIPAALIFTQALESPISSVIFIFLCILPIVSFLYVFLAKFTIKLNLMTSASETEKFVPVEFSLTLSNESPFPFPFLEADITVPGDDAIKCEKVKTRLSLIPFGKYTIAKKLSFFYRGSYEIGAAEIYCYDIFRMFRIKININLFKNILVYPRKLIYSSEKTLEESDSISDTSKRAIGEDKSEVNDYRDYRYGDSMRSIHWKLSSKSKDLIVKEYSMNSKENTLVICDSSIRYENDNSKYKSDINEAAIDSVIEAGMAVVRYYVNSSSVCDLCWIDDRSESGFYSIKVGSNDEFEKVSTLFATAPVAHSEASLATVVSNVNLSDGARVIIVTGSLNDSFVSEVEEVRNIIASKGISNLSCLAFVPYNKVCESYIREFSENLNKSRRSLERASIAIREEQLTVAKN